MNRKIKVVPAILTNDPKDLEEKIRQAESFTDIAQIDVMDGQFVPSKSILSDDLAKIRTKLYLEVHLMVMEPEKYFEGFKMAGAKRILFHYEATKNSAELLKKIKDMGFSPGLVINPQTPVDAVRPFLNDIDLLLLMAVNPGFYGAPFIPEVLDKARAISAIKDRKFILSLDGGVKLDNFMDIVKAGVEQIDVGSAIFKGEPAENYKKFVSLLK